MGYNPIAGLDILLKLWRGSSPSGWRHCVRAAKFYAYDAVYFLGGARRDTGTPTAEVWASMRDLTSERAIHVKAALFLVLGALSSVLLILDNPRASTVVLLALCVWAFARAYYYAFYLIEHYVDDRFRYSGFGSFIRYLVQRRGSQRSDR